MNKQVFVPIGAGSAVSMPGPMRDLAQSPRADDIAAGFIGLYPDAAETIAAALEYMAFGPGSTRSRLASTAHAILSDASRESLR